MFFRKKINQLVSFCWFWYKLIFRKRYKLEIDSVGKNKKDKTNKGKDKKGKKEKKNNKAAFAALLGVTYILQYNCNDIFCRFQHLNIITIIFLSAQELFELCPKIIILLMFSCQLVGFGIVFKEPSEVFSVVNLLVEHLFAVSGVMYQLVSFFCVILKHFQKKDTSQRWTRWGVRKGQRGKRGKKKKRQGRWLRNKYGRFSSSIFVLSRGIGCARLLRLSPIANSQSPITYNP